MKKGLLKRLSAIALAAIMAVSLAPVMGTMTNGVVGQVESGATEIRVTKAVIDQLQEEVNAFEAGSLTGEVLFQNVTQIIDDEEILIRISEAYEPYALSKTKFTEALLEFCDLIAQQVEIYKQSVGSIPLPIKLKQTKASNKTVMLETSAEHLFVTVDELKAYENQLRELTDGLEQGNRAEEIKVLLDENIGWFEDEDLYASIYEKYTQYITDRDTFAQVIREVLDYLESLLEEEPNPPEEPGEEEIVLSSPRIETVTNDSGQSEQKTTWDCIYFGNYPQSDVTGETTEPIKWRVLSVNGDDVMLLADMNLDGQSYNSGGAAVTWSGCNLRTWLNNDFLNAAFSSAEQAAIKTTKLVNEKNPTYGTSGGSSTYDKIYLLSITAASTNDYGFHSNSMTRKAKNTEYASNKMSSYAKNNGYGDWWLRSPGYYANGAAYVKYNGSVDDSGTDNSDILAVRPVLHFDSSNKDIWTYAGTVCSDETVQEPSSHMHVWNEAYTIDKEATCTEAGSRSIHCADCDEVKDVEEIPALGHDWGAITYTWSTDNSSVTAKRICKNDNTHVETETVNTTAKVTRATTCDSEGVTTYTAVFENDAFTKQTKSVADIPATGHNWIFTGFTWIEKPDGGYDVTANYVCNNDVSHKQSMEAVVEVKTEDATCTIAGSIVYTATVSEADSPDQSAHTDSKTVIGEALGHSWDTDYTVDKEATDTEEGQESIHCSVCGEIKEGSERVIPKIDQTQPVVEKSGWKKEGGYWYYYNEDGTKATNTWEKDSIGWCYLGADGKMVTNDWAKDSKGWCWIDAKGYMVEETKWIKVGNDWYHITNGYRDQSKWMQDSKGWCYLGKDGKMVTNGWAKDSKGWCWMGSDGYWVKNKWVKSGGYWYYLKSNGYMATGTLKISGKTYKFDSSGRWIS